ncbi:sialidase family protein [Rhodohalobacter sp. 614A]|uniref:sialidase family protein n=1 Tax=Rhodohalobacter sp. 614A TaxID=2908649 RepID=UPI001F2AE9AD|nr:sialidase family protein [Rhodohalobacter sp. 614A]
MKRMSKERMAVQCLFILFLFSGSLYAQAFDLEGVIVDYSSAETGLYLGSPSIAVLENGTYVVSIDPFGPAINKSEKPRAAKLFSSNDQGKSWTFITDVPNTFWAGLFTLDGDLYLMGSTDEYGDLAIRKSTDGGHTWTTPVDEHTGLLNTDYEYHTAPVPVVTHNGRIWRAMEDRYPPEKWGENFRALVVSAPVDSDLLDASSWTISNRLQYDHEKWEGYAWLEGNIVVTPNDELVNVLRADFRPEPIYGKAAVVNISENGETVSFTPETGFIDLPGGTKKFTIRYDDTSQKYWSLVNYIPEEYADFSEFRPDQIRNTLVLVSSKNLTDWKINKIIYQHPDVKHVGFQYADWLFENNDIVSVIRTAYPDHEGRNAHNAHDSNYIIFKRIKDFRQYE